MCWSPPPSGTGTGKRLSSTGGNASVSATFSLIPTPKPCLVPRVRGEKLRAAERAIRNAHCAVGKITKVKAAKKRRNHVLSQSPKRGERLSRGSKVALKVGR